MKTSRILTFFIGSIIVLSGIVLLIFRNNLKGNSYDYNVKVTNWDNLYEGNNIHFYYLNKDDPKLIDLKNKYDFDQVVNGGSNEIEKTIA